VKSIVGSFIALAAVGGCVPSGLPTARPDDAGGSAVIVGVLGDSWTNLPGCVWLKTADGRQSSTVWPFGWSASVDPVTILDAQGRVVARSGEQLVARGAIGQVALPDACGLGSVAFISEVLVEAPSIAP
jgi:hypothetical protein